IQKRIDEFVKSRGVRMKTSAFHDRWTIDTAPDSALDELRAVFKKPHFGMDVRFGQDFFFRTVPDRTRRPFINPQTGEPFVFEMKTFCQPERFPEPGISGRTPDNPRQFLVWRMEEKAAKPAEFTDASGGNIDPEVKQKLTRIWKMDKARV